MFWLFSAKNMPRSKVIRSESKFDLLYYSLALLAHLSVQKNLVPATVPFGSFWGYRSQMQLFLKKDFLDARSIFLVKTSKNF